MCGRDWSSDVCSSDLKIEVLPVRERPGKNQGNAKIF